MPPSTFEQPRLARSHACTRLSSCLGSIRKKSGRRLRISWAGRRILRLPQGLAPRAVLDCSATWARRLRRPQAVVLDSLASLLQQLRQLQAVVLVCLVSLLRRRRLSSRPLAASDCLDRRIHSRRRLQAQELVCSDSRRRRSLRLELGCSVNRLRRTRKAERLAVVAFSVVASSSRSLHCLAIHF